MRLATTHFHDPNGSGCPCCSEKYAAMLDETPPWNPPCERSTLRSVRRNRLLGKSCRCSV